MSRLPLVLSLSLCASLALADSPRLDVRLEERAVIARVAPGAKAACFVIAQEFPGRGTKLVQQGDVFSDEDNDGIIRIDLPRAIVPASVWVVVDLTTGQHVITAPAGAVLREQLPPSAFVSRDNGKPARLLQRELLTVFMVARPGVGAWMRKIEDGSAADADGVTDRNVAAVLDQLKPIGGSPAPPDDLRKDDVVVLANPLTLAVYDMRVVN